MTAHRHGEMILVGLDAPKTIFVWTIHEIVLALSVFFMAMLMNEVMLGIGGCMAVLYVFYDVKQVVVLRGQFVHALWRYGFSNKKDPLSFAPNPLVTRLDG